MHLSNQESFVLLIIGVIITVAILFVLYLLGKKSEKKNKKKGTRVTRLESKTIQKKKSIKKKVKKIRNKAIECLDDWYYYQTRSREIDGIPKFRILKMSSFKLINQHYELISKALDVKMDHAKAAFGGVIALGALLAFIAALFIQDMNTGQEIYASAINWTFYHTLGFTAIFTLPAIWLGYTASAWVKFNKSFTYVIIAQRTPAEQDKERPVVAIGRTVLPKLAFCNEGGAFYIGGANTANVKNGKIFLEIETDIFKVTMRDLYKYAIAPNPTFTGTSDTRLYANIQDTKTLGERKRRRGKKMSVTEISVVGIMIAMVIATILQFALGNPVDVTNLDVNTITQGVNHATGG